MQTVAKSWRQIHAVLRDKSPPVFRALRPPISNAQLQRLEHTVAAKLPKTFIESLRIHDGLRNSYLGPIRFFNYWALLPVSKIVGISKSMTTLQKECGFGGCSFKVTSRIKNDAHWRRGWLPFMDADGDKVVIDLDPGAKGRIGQVFKWSNSGSFRPSILADSFGEWLAQIADRFSKQRFKLNDEGGIWLDIRC